MYTLLNSSSSSSLPPSCSRLLSMKFILRYILVISFISVLAWLAYNHLIIAQKQTSLDESIQETIERMRAINEENETTQQESLVNLNELFHIGNCLLVESGRVIVKLRRDHENDQLGVNEKARDKSIVTRADLMSHEIIVHALNYKYRGMRVVSEEDSGTDATESAFNKSTLIGYMKKCDNYVKSDQDHYAKLKDIKVWIDPLDATKEYSENLIEYVTVMFCLVIKGKPRAGIIHKPFLNYTVSSFIKMNVTENEPRPVKQTRIVISRSHTGTAKEIVNSKNLTNTNLVIAGGAGYKTIQVLNELAELYLHTTNIYKWDICAPNAILNNHGGKLTSRRGAQIDYLTKEAETQAVTDGIVASLYNHGYYLSLFRKYAK